MPHDAEHWKVREIESALPVGPDRPHPDYCPKLRLGGVDWSIPPRGGVQPVFDGGEVRLVGSDTAFDARIAAVLSGAQVETSETCPQCGQPVSSDLVVGDETRAWLADVFALAAELLRSRYALSDAELSELLAFRGGLPDWIRQLLYWCHNG